MPLRVRQGRRRRRRAPRAIGATRGSAHFSVTAGAGQRVCLFVAFLLVVGQCDFRFISVRWVLVGYEPKHIYKARYDATVCGEL